MALYTVDPIHDPRWTRLLHQHPRASVFHTSGWLKALRRTYGYETLVLTTCSPDEELRNGILLCRVRSWITGRRLVSVPFSDHCEPLVADSEDAELLLDGLARMLGDESLAYIELRPLSDSLADVYGRFGYLANSGYWLHTIDLEPELPHLFARFHKDSTQRKIRRAEKEHLSYEEGTSEYLVRRFYVLQLMTRRRQHLPPQPLVWFLNVTRCMGESAKVRLASLGQRPIAGILTLRHKDTVVYKYGASDARFHNLGGVALLFWRTIQEAKSCGIRRFDLGRSDLDNEGLATFKDRWSGARTKLTYWRCSRRENTRQGVEAVRVAQGLLGQMPDWVLAAFGKLLYRHIG